MRELVRNWRRAVVAATLSLALVPSQGPAVARAEEVLQFKPVDPESTSQLERSATRRRRSVEASPRTPDSPESPDTPVTPEPPVVPDVPKIGRSGDLPGGRSGDIMRLGSDVTIDRDQVVDGDVVAIGGDVHIEGEVHGDVAALGGDLYLGSESKVTGDVACLGGELKEEQGASVGGQRVTAMSAFNRRHHNFGPFVEHNVARGTFLGVAKIVSSLVWLLFLVGMCWAYVTFAPKRTAVVVDTIRREPGSSLLVGFLTTIMMVPSLVALCLVVVILCITIIGIPVGIAALFAYFGMVIVIVTWGYVGGAAWLGGRLPWRGADPVSILRAALVTVISIQALRLGGAVIQLVPFIGWLGGLMRFAGIVAASLVVMLGAGALIRSKLGQGPEGRWWPLVRPATPMPPGGAPAVATAGIAPSPPPSPMPPPSPPAMPAESAPPNPTG